MFSNNSSVTDNLLNAMVNRMNLKYHSSVDLTGTTDEALAIVNNATRVVLSVGGPMSHEDMRS